jgi:hypothetical protein
MESSHMPGNSFNSFHRFALATIAFLGMACIPFPAMAQQSAQKTFSSPEDASAALVAAAQNNDEKVMLEILGPAGKEIVSSGDDAEDAESRAHFVEKYREMHRLVKEPDGTTVLYIGAENWPTPIPIVQKGHLWFFDTRAGEKEILYRRIGRNELSTLRVCQELVAAEKEFYSSQHNEYAHKVFSDEGQHNGLYWKAAAGESPSPIGPLVASAFTEGHGESQGSPTPYRGYYYRTLKGKNEKVTEGFVFLAYPAEYRSSGVMTFIVSQDGVVYEKDLGKKTEGVARGLKEFKLDSSWHKAELPQEETASNQ